MSNIYTSLPTSPPKTAKAFPLFSLLAPELRLKIWYYACFPRTIPLRYIPSSDTCLSPSKHPSILHVNRESRDEALRTYSLAFGTRSSPARVYFNPYLDTIYLPRHRHMGYDETLRDFRTLVVDEDEQGKGGLLDKARRIALDHVDVEVKRPWESYNKASLIRSFPDLEEVVLVLCQKNQRMGIRGKEVRFANPKESVEDILRLWVEFRQSFMVEERTLEAVCKDVGMEYRKFSLPTLRIKSKILMEGRT